MEDPEDAGSRYCGWTGIDGRIRGKPVLGRHERTGGSVTGLAQSDQG